MKNDLFNQTLLKKYSKDFKLTPSKHDLIKEYLKKLDSSAFKLETSNYPFFYSVMLMGILGYEDKNISPENKPDSGSGKSDFTLQVDGKNFMVIELKRQGVDLDKKQSGRSDNKSPVEQAFGYVIHSGDVEWIMVSDYEEFRLYNYHDKTKYISFNVRDLLDIEMYSYFMLSFSKHSHIESDLIKKVHEGTLLVDRKFAGEFYKLYNETRLMLIKELEEINQLDKLEAIHYAQLILNRYMFVCFAEDTGLLPSQVSVDTISTPILKGNLRHNSIWHRLNELFLDINEGNEFKDISGYNGGLFEKDLESIKIRDVVDDQSIFQDTYQNWKFEAYEKDIKHLLGNVGTRVNPIYRNMLTISSFDFQSELDVNILGHIFENSIGDIEELKEDTRGRRKKEGIFYTPDYITDYICKNTIIPYLSKLDKVNSVADLLEEYSWSNDIEDLDEKLKNIKIVDPACGSGAFLNKATDILLEIHEGIFDIKKGYITTTDMKVGKGKRRRTETVHHTDLGAYVFDHIEKRREILLNNIYGVDLNEESVDITKLSLFLKVCKKDLKLPNLDKNIKCGNSLIDDPTYTDKPFNWEQKFPEIFKEGGFDICIGNPPYVRQEKIKEIKPYLKEHYKVYTGVADLYVYFFEKGLNILKRGGMFAFICSDKFIRTRYGKNLKNFILDHQFKKYTDYKGKGVFEDATVDPCIIVLKNEFPTSENKILVNNEFEIYQTKFNNGVWNFEPPELINLKDKIDNESVKIKDIAGVKIFFGIKTGFNEAFIVNESTKNQLVAEDHSSSDILKPLVSGRDIQKWKIDYKNNYLIWTYMGVPIDKYPAIIKHLSQYEEKLKKRVDQGNHWWELRSCDYYEEYEKPKLIYPYIKSSLFAIYDDQGYYTLDTAAIITSTTINIKYLGVLLSSKVLNFFLRRICYPLARTSTDPKEKVRYKLSKQYIEQLPIFLANTEEQQPFIEKADKMLQLNKQLQKEVNGFKHWIEKEFNVDKMSKRLEKYYELSEDEFIIEMKKKKVDTRPREIREDLEDYFNKSVAIIKPLLQEIEETDYNINQMVYELYGLTGEEIKIIEDNLD